MHASSFKTQRTAEESFVNFQPQQQFLTNEETMMFFKRDQDMYFRSLTVPDLYARKMGNIHQYIVSSMTSARSFTDIEKIKISDCCHKADKFFAEIGDSVHGLYGSLINNIPWRFAKTYGTLYEQGYPHTRADIIFVSNMFLMNDPITITQTLIHEKVHVYQRLYPDLVKEYLVHMGFTRHALRKSFPNIRANPDLDDWTYMHNGQLCIYNYTTPKPHSINDVVMSGTTEHPYEHMAYYIASLLKAGFVTIAQEQDYNYNPRQFTIL